MTQPAQLAHILASSPYQEHVPHQRRALSSPGDCSGPTAGSTSSPAASSSDARYFPHHGGGGFSDSSDIEGNSSSTSTYSNYSSPPSSAQSSANTSFVHHQAFPIDCYTSSAGKTEPSGSRSASASSSSYAYQSSPLSHEHYYSSSASVSQHHPLHSYQLHQYHQPQSQSQQQQYPAAPLMHTSHSMTQQHSQPMHDNQLPPLPEEHYQQQQQQQQQSQQQQSLHSSHGYSSQQSHTGGEMDTSMFRSQYGGLPPLQAPRAGCIPGLSMDKPASAASSADRAAAAPALKRSRTAPGLIFSSPTAAATDAHQKLKEKRPAGKNGEDVWPEDVEIAFFESIRLVPKLGRKKIVVNDKPCGRNELIGDYIRRKTGRIRSRKQVSSHIQVLKNIKADDEEFMNLVAEPKAGEGEDDFRPDAKTLFFLPQEFAHVWKESPSLSASPPELARGYRSYAIPPSSTTGSAIQSQFLSQPLAPLPSRDGLLSPYCSGNGSFFSQSSSSSASSPGLSSACSTRATSPYYPLPTPGGTVEMTNQVFHLSLDPPSPNVFYQGATPTAPMPAGAISGPVPAQYAYTLEDSSSAPTPKVSPSKLGHRRAASKGLSLHIPPNDFNKLQPRQPEHANGGQQGQLQPQASASNPSTPWPQMLHTPVNPPPAPNMLGSPTQKNRLQAVWARDTADWNKASPALEGAFNYELGDALSSSQNLQKMAARQSTPLKRSYTEGDCSPAKKTRKGGDAAEEEACAVPPVPALTPAHAPASSSSSSSMRQSRSSVGAFSFPPKPAAAETCSSPAAYPFSNMTQRDVFDARASSPYQQQQYSQHSQQQQQSQPAEPVSQDDAFFSSLLGAREV